jgi:hypothetical protein
LWEGLELLKLQEPQFFDEARAHQLQQPAKFSKDIVIQLTGASDNKEIEVSNLTIVLEFWLQQLPEYARLMDAYSSSGTILSLADWGEEAKLQGLMLAMCEGVHPTWTRYTRCLLNGRVLRTAARDQSKQSQCSYIGYNQNDETGAEFWQSISTHRFQATQMTDTFFSKSKSMCLYELSFGEH